MITMFCTAAFSCSNDSEIHTISGNWNLTNTTTAEGSTLNYHDGDVVWSFIEKSGTLNVHNSIITLGPESASAGPGTGSYKFTLKSEHGMEYLYIDGNKVGAVANTGDNLVISTGVNNGSVKVFRR